MRRTVVGLVRVAWGLFRSSVYFMLGVALAFSLAPGARRQLFAYLLAPDVRRPAISGQGRSQRLWGDSFQFDDARRIRPSPWERVCEVADGHRAFAAEDLPAFHAQSEAIDRAYSAHRDFAREDLEEERRKVRLVEYGALDTGSWGDRARKRDECDLVSAFVFHLEGVDATGGDWLAHADALLTYVETHERPAVRLVGQERALREVLRHLARVQHTRDEYAWLARRLDEHVRRCGTLASLLAEHPAWRPSDCLVAEERRWSGQCASLSVTLSGDVRDRPPRERDRLVEALARPGREALGAVLAYDFACEREERAPRPVRDRLLGLVFGNLRMMVTAWTRPYLVQAVSRELQWATLRAGVPAAVWTLAGQPRALPPDPSTGEPLVMQRTGEGFRLYARGPDGRDEGGQGDDVLIWPPPRAPAVPPCYPGYDPLAERPARFDGPRDALEAALVACARRTDAWRVITVKRPARGEDRLCRAGVLICGALRFHELGALLHLEHLGADGRRGELTAQPGGLHALRYDVRIPPARHSLADGGTPRLVRVAAATPRELLAAFDRAVPPEQAPDLARIAVIHQPGKLWLTALVADRAH